MRKRLKWLRWGFWLCLAWVAFGFFGRLSLVDPNTTPAAVLLGGLADLAVSPSSWLALVLGIFLYREKRRGIAEGGREK